MTDLPIILLAAGASSRMRGTDKLLEIVDGQPLLRRQAARARGVTTGPVLVALPPPPHPRYAALSGLDVKPIPVPDASEGMNASLRQAFAALPPDAPAAMLMLADLPELTERDLNVVAQAVDLTSETLIWRGSTEDDKPGHPIVFTAALFPAFANLTGDGGGREVVAQAGTRVQLVPLPGQHARLDLDTPEDWAAWRAGR
ncbi:nucleotidyltransferase family protein [Seohaeicola zhoushanensis]|uniref:Molybdopterin-guanine dinucleotide biosynthesis protein A n=1 Tax=Seohaeicola zhoushanensis TaxID=1569283 RepID=A0A8J3MAB2_9RHOB|nr:nucleotidyltransferase family protein [Seohaeicola zhoushanensis]GHF55870.1 molybdopterin-guanine dinucleotide biosynthesis protein A [Seohaeicola zhoushanensis]